MLPKEFRRHLRKVSTSGEKVLWQLLRNRHFLNLKFRRQHTIGIYTADFYCPSLRLVIEVDGNSHDCAEARQRDRIRDQILNRMGYKVYRVDNYAVVHFPENVLEELKNVVSLIPAFSQREKGT